MIDAKMVFIELLGLADLSEAQALHIYETTEVIMVCKDKKLILITFQIVRPHLKGLNNSQKLAVVSLIPSLCKNHFPRKEGYWMPLAQIGLSDYSIWPSSKSKLA